MLTLLLLPKIMGNFTFEELNFLPLIDDDDASLLSPFAPDEAGDRRANQGRTILVHFTGEKLFFFLRAFAPPPLQPTEI